KTRKKPPKRVPRVPIPKTNPARWKLNLRLVLFRAINRHRLASRDLRLRQTGSWCPPELCKPPLRRQAESKTGRVGTRLTQKRPPNASIHAASRAGCAWCPPEAHATRFARTTARPLPL